MKKTIISLLMCGSLAASMSISAGAVNLYFNGQPMVTDVPAQIINDRTMVPIGHIFNAFGATVTWDDSTKTAIGEKDGTRVVIQIGNTTAYVNDTPVVLDTPALIVDSRTMVPAWFVSEAFGASVTWDGETSSVYIDTKGGEAVETPTVSQQNALESAKSYLSFTSFSREGLIDQLEFEKYPTEDAIWAADNCGADWNEQALKSAKSYIDLTGFSYSGLIDQLEFEGFTAEQAKYGADNCGADWYAEAVESAQSYLDFSSFSRQGLIDQLEFEGFTAEQAENAVNQVGL